MNRDLFWFVYSTYTFMTSCKKIFQKKLVKHFKINILMTSIDETQSLRQDHRRPRHQLRQQWYSIQLIIQTYKSQWNHWSVHLAYCIVYAVRINLNNNEVCVMLKISIEMLNEVWQFILLIMPVGSVGSGKCYFTGLLENGEIYSNTSWYVKYYY